MQVQEKYQYIVEKFDETFRGLVFNEANHTYTTDGGLTYLPSVSALIKNHVKHVNFDELAKFSAEKAGKTVEEIKVKWNKKRDDAADRGTKVHKYAEDYPRVAPPSNKLEEQVKKFYDELPEHVVVVSKELRMYHHKFRYAGTADIILYNTQTNKLIIADFKTNEDLYKSYDRLLAPFDYLPSNNLNKYQIQLNYYQMMLEQAGFQIESKVIIWLKETGYQKLYCNDYMKELNGLMNKNITASA